MQLLSRSLVFLALVKSPDETAGLDFSKQTIVDEGFGVSTLGLWIIFFQKSQHRLDTTDRWVRRNVIEFRRHQIIGPFEAPFLLRTRDSQLLGKDIEAFAFILFKIDQAFHETAEKSDCLVAIGANVGTRRRQHRLEIKNIRVGKIHQRAITKVLPNKYRRARQYGSLHSTLFQGCTHIRRGIELNNLYIFLGHSPAS